MRNYKDSVSSAVNGLPVYLAEIRVLDSDDAPAQLYSDNGVTPLSQPVLTNGLGEYGFYVADGVYTLVVSGPGGTNSVNFPDTEIFDLSEMSALASGASVAATLAGHYANDDTDDQVPGQDDPDARGGKYWNDLTATNAALANAAADAAVTASGFANAFPTLALALAGTTDGQYSAVPQAAGYAADNYLRTSGSLGLFASSPVGSGALATQQRALEGTLTALPATPVIEIQCADGKFTDGAFIPNRIGTAPTRNFMEFFNFITTGGTATVTYGQTDPWAGTTGIRIRQPDGASSVSLLPISSGATPSEAGDYRISFMVRSHVGAGAQTLKLRKNNSSPSTSIAVTEGAWVLADVTFTGLVNNDFIGVFNDAGPYPLDIDISLPAVTRPQIALPSHPVHAVGAVIDPRLSRPGNITIDNFGNIAAPYKGRIKFTDDAIATRSFTAMTMLVTFKQTASSPAFTFNAPFWARSTGQPDIVLGTEANVFSIKGPGLTGFTPDPSWLAFGDEFLTLCLRFDATRTTASLGSVTLASGTGTGGTPYLIPWAYFGGGGFNDTNPLTGLINSLVIFDQYLEDAPLSAAVNHVQGAAQLYGNSIGARNIVLSPGDSITNGAGATGSNGYMQQLATALNLKRINFAVDGSNFAGMITSANGWTRLQTNITQALRDGRRPIVHILIGTNSPMPTAPAYQAAIDTLRALGAKVIVGTIPSRTGIPSATTDAYNTLIRGLSYDALADYAADARIGGPGAAANTTYFNGDGIHPNDTGHGIMKPIGQAAVLSLMQ